MRVICAWCSKDLFASAADDAEVSHGICVLCRRDFLGETWLSLKEAVVRMPFPALLVDGEFKVETANARATTLVGKNSTAGDRPLAGVLIGCANSRLPGGCGHSSQCVGCVLRNTATATLADGVTRNAVSTAHKLLEDGGEQNVLITFSVERISTGVLIYIEGVCGQPAGAALDQGSPGARPAPAASRSAHPVG